MKKTWRKRVLTYYGPRTIEVKIAVYDSDDGLTKDELDHMIDVMTERGMSLIKDAPYSGAPLHKIKVRNAK